MTVSRTPEEQREQDNRDQNRKRYDEIAINRVIEESKRNMGWGNWKVLKDGQFVDMEAMTNVGSVSVGPVVHKKFEDNYYMYGSNRFKLENGKATDVVPLGFKGTFDSNITLGHKIELIVGQSGCKTIELGWEGNPPKDEKKLLAFLERAYIETSARGLAMTYDDTLKGLIMQLKDPNEIKRWFNIERESQLKVSKMEFEVFKDAMRGHDTLDNSQVNKDKYKADIIKGATDDEKIVAIEKELNELDKRMMVVNDATEAINKSINAFEQAKKVPDADIGRLNAVLNEGGVNDSRNSLVKAIEKEQADIMARREIMETGLKTLVAPQAAIAQPLPPHQRPVPPPSPAASAALAAQTAQALQAARPSPIMPQAPAAGPPSRPPPQAPQQAAQGAGQQPGAVPPPPPPPPPPKQAAQGAGQTAAQPAAPQAAAQAAQPAAPQAAAPQAAQPGAPQAAAQAAQAAAPQATAPQPAATTAAARAESLLKKLDEGLKQAGQAIKATAAKGDTIADEIKAEAVQQNQQTPTKK